MNDRTTISPQSENGKRLRCTNEWRVVLCEMERKEIRSGSQSVDHDEYNIQLNNTLEKFPVFSK